MKVDQIFGNLLALFEKVKIAGILGELGYFLAYHLFTLLVNWSLRLFRIKKCLHDQPSFLNIFGNKNENRDKHNSYLSAPKI